MGGILKGIKEVIIGTGAVICGLLIEVIATLEKTLYWAITDGFYQRNFIYNLSIPLIILGIILIVISYKKKNILQQFILT